LSIKHKNWVCGSDDATRTQVESKALKINNKLVDVGKLGVGIAYRLKRIWVVQ